MGNCTLFQSMTNQVRYRLKPNISSVCAQHLEGLLTDGLNVPTVSANEGEVEDPLPFGRIAGHGWSNSRSNRFYKVTSADLGKQTQISNQPGIIFYFADKQNTITGIRIVARFHLSGSLRQNKYNV